MSKQESTVLEVREVHDYPFPEFGLRKFVVIEYEVIKTEINRYFVYQKEDEKK